MGRKRGQPTVSRNDAATAASQTRKDVFNLAAKMRQVRGLMAGISKYLEATCLSTNESFRSADPSVLAKKNSEYV